MIEELAKRSRLSGSSPIARISTPVSQKSERSLLVHLRLCSVYSVKCLIQEQPQGPRVIYPWGTVLVQRGSIPQHSQKVCDDKRKARQGDGVRGHAHGETFYNEICIKGLENIFGEQRVVDSGVLVLAERRELLLSYVDHRDGFTYPAKACSF